MAVIGAWIGELPPIHKVRLLPHLRLTTPLAGLV
jgi:hypothetical protein